MQQCRKFFSVSESVKLDEYLQICNKICEVYRSHLWRHGYPPSGLRIPGPELKKFPNDNLKIWTEADKTCDLNFETLTTRL